MRNYSSKRYYEQSTLSRLIDSQEAHGRTQKELEQAKKEIQDLLVRIETLIQNNGLEDVDPATKDENE